MQARFCEITESYPEGTPTEMHKQLQRRRGYDVDCDDGVLVVSGTPCFPTLVVRCDECGFEAVYPYRALQVL